MKIKELKRLLFNHNIDKYQLFGKFKLECKFDDFAQAIKEISSHPLAKKIIFNNPLPKNFNEIKKNRIIPPTNNLDGELALILYVIESHYELINKFLILKEKFELSFLLNNLEEAEDILNDIEQNICKSIWSIENRLLLREFKEGSEANWNELSKFSQLISDQLVLFLVEAFSKRAESKISYFRYCDLMNNQFKYILPDELSEYLQFRLSYTAYTGFETFPFFLAIEGNSSIIDRYLILVDVISDILTNSKDQEIPNSVKKTVLQLSKKINDRKITQFSYFLGLNNFQILDNSDKFFNLIDKYTKGDFAYVLKNSNELIKLFPDSIELYEIYIKSLIELKKDFNNLNISPLIDKILNNLYNIYSYNEKSINSKLELEKIYLSFFSTNWGKQLFSLINEQTKNRENNTNFLFILNSKFNNPRLLNFISSNSNFYQEICTFYETNFPENKSVFVNKNINLADFKSLENDNEISSIKKQIYIARALLKAQKFHELKDFCEKLILLNSNPYCYEEIINHLYNSYLKINSLKEAAQLFVENRLRNRAFTYRLDAKNLLLALDNNKDNEFSDVIDIPIFYKFSTIDPYKRYVAYDTFITSLNIEKPSEIIQSELKFNEKKLVFFLKEVCTTDVLNFSLYLGGLDDVENERLKILSILLQLDSENESQYIKEIAELKQNADIRIAIREVNKGRITVNVAQLKSIEESNVKEGFTRFQELIKYAQNNKDVVGIDISIKDIEQYFKNLIEEKNQNPEGIKNDPAFISFKSMFFDLRDKFLLSKEYGLDGYLSTRIRHGTLENHIRSVFESHNLISEKDENDNYSEIKLWNDIMPQTLERYSYNIQIIFREFSKKIDETIQNIISELIQVYTEKQDSKPKAIFNYSFTEEYLWLVFNYVKDDVTDYNQFLDHIFNVLEGFTETRLKIGRDLFMKDIKNLFVQQIDELSEKIINILGINNFVELTSSINLCKTEIQNELENISEWFNLSNPSKDLRLDIETILKTSVEITNSIYPNYQLQTKLKLNIDIPIYGDINLFYITRILLDNIIKHSQLTSNELETEIETKIVNEKLIRLIFKNSLSPKINQKLLSEALEAVKEKWSKNKNFERINFEGGSGFDKIRRILAFDIKSKNYDFNFLIEENYIIIMIDTDFKLNE